MTARTGLIVAVVILFGTLCVVATWAIVSPRQPVMVATDIPALPTPPPTPTTREKTLLESLSEMDYAHAFAATRMGMKDTYDEESAGTALFSVWASNSLRWADVAVTTDETTNALALKDPDTARGRRLCTSGTIYEVHPDRGEGIGELWHGNMDNGGSGFYHFYAARSTGTLTTNSWARFCGVVTGLFDYSNSGGGTTHAVAIVGMFDLPENRAATTAATSTGLPRRMVVPPRPTTSLGPSPLRY
jgi:hypothetical protein